jgi:molybdenum cofactor biosynthesis protein B
LKHHTQDVKSAAIGVLTVSDTRTPETDRSGAAICERLVADGHSIVDYRIVPDEVDTIVEWVVSCLARKDCDAVIVNGGTGISSRDRTIEALDELIERELAGFGELFRAFSFEEIGARAMLSRAIGGVARGKPLFALPGSPAAAAMGLERLILPVLGHLLAELRKH